MKANRRQAVFLFGAALLSGLLCSVALAGNPHGNPPGQANQQQTTTSDNSAGVKPSNNTSKGQTCTTGGGQGSSASCQSSTYPGKQDSSKRYGNGKTAGQIANSKGAPSGTPVYGPGNSQPHKICGRDVHAYKGANDKKCPSSTHSGSQSGTQSGSTKSSVNAAANGTGSTAGTSASSSNPSTASGVKGASHTSRSKPVAAHAKPAQAVLGAASFTG